MVADSNAKATSPTASDRDAQLRFCMSPDSMRLGISRYVPAKGNGRPLSADLIREQLKKAGVTLAPVPGAPEKVLDHLKQGKDVRKVVLVRGIPVQEPEDASIVPAGEQAYPVFGGEICAHHTPPKSANMGRTIDGQTKEPTKTHKPRDSKVRVGKNCKYNPRERTFTADCYGLINIADNKVSIKPLLKISDDLVDIIGKVYHRNMSGEDITEEHFRSELRMMGVDAEINKKKLSNAIHAAKTSGKAVDKVLIAGGKTPVDGHDGKLELLVKAKAIQSKEDPEGRVDYRDRGYHPTAQPEEHIARIHPPQRGIGGVDVYGKPIPANDGAPLSLLPGENVEVLEEGRLFRSKTHGMVMVDKNTISVSEVLLVNSDVSISTGNVRAELGSVRVRGSVQSGLTVTAPNHIIVEEVVESAQMEARGDIEVKGGILMPDGGLVRAGGTITAQFATNAHVEADGDIHIDNNLTNCLIETRGKLIASAGRGVIQGGTVICGRGVECNEIGTELGVVTTIVVTNKFEEDLNLPRQMRTIKKHLRKIDSVTGGRSAKALMLKVRPEKRKAVADLFKRKIAMNKKLEELKQQMALNTTRRLRALSEARIKVRKRIHPGVVIKIGGRVMNVTKPIDRSQIYWDYRERELVIRNM